MSHLVEIEAFLAVVEEGSFTAAARRLAVTKSYASKLVVRLEDRLGIRLLQRTTRQLTLTEPGRTYFERCSEAMRALKDAEAEATELQRCPHGRLRITLPTAFGTRYLSEPIAEFKERYSALIIEAVLVDRQVDILAEGFDAGVRISEPADSSLIARKLTTVDRVICGSPDYLRRRGTPARPEDLASHDCLLYAYHAMPTVWRLKGDGRVATGDASVEVTGTMVSNHGDILVEAACRGLGLVYCPVFLTADLLREGRLRRVLPGWRYTLTVSVVHPNVHHVPAKVRLFLEFLAAHFQSVPWADCS